MSGGTSRRGLALVGATLAALALLTLAALAIRRAARAGADPSANASRFGETAG